MMMPVIGATGMGSWPGMDPREAIITIRDLLSDHLPYLPETPARGPGADVIGRGAGILTDLPVELQPSGWRLTSRPGRDLERTASLWGQDLDELAEAYDGYSGRLKVAVAGPWTLAASIELPGGERAVADLGASIEIAESLADGIAALATRMARQIPGAEVVVQLDEPTLPAVLTGTLPTASGFGRLRPVDAQEVLRGLQLVTGSYAGETLIHCCHPTAPIRVLRQGGADGLALDLTDASAARWESVATTLEAGQRLYAGLLPTDDASPSIPGTARDVLDHAERVGIEPALVQGLVVSPACGLGGASRQDALAIQRAAIDLAGELNAHLDR